MKKRSVCHARADGGRSSFSFLNRNCRRTEKESFALYLSAAEWITVLGDEGEAMLPLNKKKLQAKSHHSAPTLHIPHSTLLLKAKIICI